MPSNDPSPPIAFLTEVDARSYNGVTLFNMSAGGAVAGPAQDFFEDALNFLNGRCSPAGLDLDATIKTIGAAQVPPSAGVWTIFLNADDKVVIENDTDAFDLDVGGGREAFGFPATGVLSSAAGGSGQRIIAANNWVRGNVQNAHLIVNETATAVPTFNVPDIAYRAQDVITMLRSITLADADGDDRGLNLTVSTQGVYGATGGYRWGLNAIGHAWLAVDGSRGTAPDASGFLFDDFQLWLGFKGDETLQIVADATTGTNLEFIEATYPCQGAIMPSRPMIRRTDRVEETTHAVRLTSGELASNKVMDWHTHVIEWWLDGPADCRDLSSHWLNAVIPRAPKAVRWALYQVWGDPRRARFDADVRTDTAGTVEEFDLLGTAELDGYRGRIRGRRSMGDSAQKTIRWPSPLRRRVRMTTILEDAED